MSTPANATKRRTDVLQLERDVPEDVEPSSTAANTDPNDNWGTEPNFNLNFNLSSTTHPRPTKEPSKMHSGSKKEDKNKGGAAAADFNTISVQSEKLRSKIPTAQMTVKNKVGQQPKSPNIKHSSSPKVQSHGNLALSPKPTGVELRSSQRSTERVRTETPKAESVKPVTPEPTTNPANNITPTQKMQSNSKDVKDIHLETPPKTLQLPKNPKVQNQKGDKSRISPKLTNRTPTMMAKIKKTDPVNSTTDQKPEVDSGAQGVFTTSGTSQKEKTGSPLLRSKPSPVTSLSPKPSTQRKTTGTRTVNVSRSEGNLHSKDLKAVSASRIRVKSSSTPKSTERSKDSLDSKLSSRSRDGSRDALESRSSSASKSSLDSRDSLDSKKFQSSKVIRNPLDPKTSAGTRMKKSHQGSEKVTDSKTVPKNNHDSKLLQNSKASFDPKMKTKSSSDSKPGITQSRSLQASAFNMDLLGCGSFSPISSGTIKTSGSAVELSFKHKSQSDSSRSGQVLPGSESTLTDLSSLISATQSPGSSTGKGFASTVTGPNKENQKSPSFTPGILAPLASSSPKTRPVVTSKILEGSTDTSEDPAVMKKDPNTSSRNTSLTRGLTFDSITKPGNNTDNKHLKEVNTQGKVEVSQEAKSDRDGRPSGDSEGKSVPPLSKAGHPGDTNIISSPRAARAGEPKQKIQVHGKKNEGNPSSPLRLMSSSSTHTPTKKKVKEAAPKPELSQRLHKRSQKEVGVQVGVKVVERSASTSPSLHRGPPTSSMIGSSSCQSSLSGVPPLKHVCQIEIELCSQTLLPCIVPDKASSLPACLRFQQNPALMSRFGPHHNPDVSAESIWEDETKEEEQWQPNKKQEDGFKGQTEKPPEVLWDKQGMTWEVYGASVDLESLGTAIQSHLEMKIREQERHIRILRKSVCSNSSFARYKRKKRRRRFLGCCVKASAVAD